MGRGELHLRIRLAENEFEATGDKRFIEKKYTDFLRMVGLVQQPEPTSGTAKKRGGEPTIKSPATNIGAFFEEKNPRGQEEQVAVLGYYLEHFGHKKELTVDDFKQSFGDARQPSPVHLADVLVNAVNRSRYLVRIGTGVYRVSAKGVKLVTEKLPRKQ